MPQCKKIVIVLKIGFIFLCKMYIFLFIFGVNFPVIHVGMEYDNILLLSTFESSFLTYYLWMSHFKCITLYG